MSVHACVSWALQTQLQRDPVAAHLVPTCRESAKRWPAHLTHWSDCANGSAADASVADICDATGSQSEWPIRWHPCVTGLTGYSSARGKVHAICKLQSAVCEVQQWCTILSPRENELSIVRNAQEDTRKNQPSQASKHEVSAAKAGFKSDTSGRSEAH